MKISREYLELQKKLHSNENYGVASIKHAPQIKKIMLEGNYKTLSDYGAGKKNLFYSLNKIGFKEFEYLPYDPVFPEYGNPKQADLVCCIDVMEHVEMECLDDVLDDIKSIVTKLCYFSIATKPAGKFLDDGRNAHLIQKTPRWWLPKLCELFEIDHLQLIPGGFVTICRPLILEK